MKAVETIRRVCSGENISSEASAEFMRHIVNGEVTPAQFGAFTMAMKMKGETPQEIAGMVIAMREASVKVRTDLPLVDTCGCGGDGMSWFNISTAAAIVASAAGAIVAKHGNRAISGSSGSADVLEILGVSVEAIGPDAAKKCLDEEGLAFLFAPLFHPAMKHIAPLRREIGVPTVFNVLGPLVNPAGVRRQVIGAPSPELANKIAQTLRLLGTEYALVVHAESGADEIDPEGHTLVYQVTPEMTKRRRTSSADFGLPESGRSHLKISTPAESAEMILNVLKGVGAEHNAPPSGSRSAFIAVVINAAAALVAAGKAVSFQDGAEMAREAIVSGQAEDKLRRFVRLSNSLG